MKMLKNGCARLQLAAVQCNYKNIYGQWKELFIHGLNDIKMLAEIINALTKAEKNTNVTSEQVLAWEKRGPRGQAISH